MGAGGGVVITGLGCRIEVNLINRITQWSFDRFRGYEVRFTPDMVWKRWITCIEIASRFSTSFIGSANQMLKISYKLAAKITFNIQDCATILMSCAFYCTQVVHSSSLKWPSLSQRDTPKSSLLERVKTDFKSDNHDRREMSLKGEWLHRFQIWR